MKPSRIIDFAVNYFDFSFYSRKYSDVPQSQPGGLDHFLMHGIAEGRSPHSALSYLTPIENATNWRTENSVLAT